MEKEDIKELALAIQEGDEAAFRQFFDLYFDRIYAFLMSILRNNEDAEDVTSVAFIYVWDNREKLREPEQLVSWLYQVAKHRAFDLRRKYKGKGTTSLDGLYEILPADNPTMAQKTDQHFLAQRVEELLEDLSSKDRAILHLRFYEDLDFNQIAERLDATAVAVRVRYHRLVKKLKNKDE